MQVPVIYLLEPLEEEPEEEVLRVPSGLRNGARAPVAFNLATVSVFQPPTEQQEMVVWYKPLHNVVVLLQPSIVHPARFSPPVRLVDIDTHVDRPDALLGMTLNLGHDVLAWEGSPIDPSAQRVDNVAEGVIAGYGIVGVLDPKLDGAGDLTFVSGEGSAVDSDMGWFRHRGEVRLCKMLRWAVRCLEKERSV